MPKCKKYYKDITKYQAYNKRHKQKYYEKGRVNCHTHNWTYDEIDLILYSNLTDIEISQLINHSVAAIQTKRSKIKKEFGIK